MTFEGKSQRNVVGSLSLARQVTSKFSRVRSIRNTSNFTNGTSGLTSTNPFARKLLVFSFVAAFKSKYAQISENSLKLKFSITCFAINITRPPFKFRTYRDHRLF